MSAQTPQLKQPPEPKQRAYAAFRP